MRGEPPSGYVVYDLTQPHDNGWRNGLHVQAGSPEDAANNALPWAQRAAVVSLGDASRAIIFFEREGFQRVLRDQL